MQIDLRGKRALVCGGTQGIGRACALAFAEAGADVTIAARDAEKIAAMQAELSTAANQSHFGIAQDFNDALGLQRLVARHIEQHGPYHILLNNTGGPPGGELTEAHPDAFRRAFEMHVIVNQMLTQALLPGMRGEGYGRIINIVSLSVKTPIAWLGVSNTTRGAVASWAKTLAGEVAKYGVTVNSILPGAIATGRLASLLEKQAESQGKELHKVRNAWLKDIPAGRFGEPEEIANMATFLASPAASYVTGTAIPVDGGRVPCI